MGKEYKDAWHVECEQILRKLNSEQYPETINFLEWYQDEILSEYEIATELAQCDTREVMPRVVFNLLVRLYECAIESGDDDAMNDLGALYYDGRGCEQSFEKALLYYDMAAKHGNRQAQENLGYCYLYGRNVDIDYEKAFNYFAMGAFTGHLISLYKIGDMYQQGYYVKKNPEEAFKIYERCLETMTEEASEVVAGPVLLRMGKALLEGIGTEKDPRKAFMCFQNAENYLYDMVDRGEVMYMRSLEEAIEGQRKAREILKKKLPNREWVKGGK